MPSKYTPKNSAYRNEPHVGTKAPKSGTPDDLNAMTMAGLFADEDKAREFMEAKRWPNGPVCPHCGSEKAYRLVGKPESKKPVRKGVCKCNKCRQQFTVKVGTIFEDSKLPIRYWLYAIHLMTSSKKGVSSHQIARELGITVKSAWFMTHRIRESMKLEPMAGMLKGTVEVDECYIGGKPRHGSGKPSSRGAGTPKQPVVVLVERDGAAVAKPIERVTTESLRREMEAVIATDATLMTDEHAVYTPTGKQYAAHYTTHHRSKQYARRENGISIHSNTAESYFALLKRGHYGVFHQLSKGHLARYLVEFCYRWKHRHVSDGERMVQAIKGAAGKRLMYRQPKGRGGNGLVSDQPGE
jgi:transposase-like protein